MKLYYFDFKGLGEAARLIAKAGGVDFEDCRVKMEQWPALKPSMPMGQMPVLEVDGKKISQGVAIAIYLAECGNLLPATKEERAKALELTVAWSDAGSKTSGLMALKEDKPAMKKMFDSVMADFVLPRLGIYEEHLKGSSSGFLTSKLSYADLFSYNMFKGQIHFFNVDMGKFPAIAAFIAKIEAEPKVAEYIASQKDVPFAPMAFHQMVQ